MNYITSRLPPVKSFYFVERNVKTLLSNVVVLATVGVEITQLILCRAAKRGVVAELWGWRRHLLHFLSEENKVLTFCWALPHAFVSLPFSTPNSSKR